MAKHIAKVLRHDETYLDTPYKVMKAIEKAIGREFTIEEIGRYYHLIHLSIDGIEERGHMLTYGNHLFRVVFNSELTAVIVKV